APAVHHWLSLQLGKHPEAAVDLETYWTDWSETTQPPVTPSLVLAGRARVIDEIRGWLQDPSRPLALQADARDEATAAFGAALQHLEPEERIAFLSRTLVVHDAVAWGHLAAAQQSLILIPLFDSGEMLSRAMRGGHRVVVPLGRSDATSTTTIVVPRLDRAD